MPKEKPRVNIGEVIRTYRSQRSLSQGKIEEAMDISLADFFPGTETPRDRETQKALGELSQDEIRFLAEIKKYRTTLSDGDKRLVLAMIRKMATLLPVQAAKKLVARRTTA